MLESTSKYRVHDIIFDNGEFALARGYWESEAKLSLACRWHAEGIGYPQTFGKPQWMMFPRDVSVEITDALELPERAKVAITFHPRKSD